MIDNLAVVYNTKLLKAAGVARPRTSWTWNDYRALAKKLTNANKDIIGTGYPDLGQRGHGLAPVADDLAAGWRGARRGEQEGALRRRQGVKALQLLSDMALKDKSLYPDQTPDTQKMYGLFNSGKMAMIVTGPWQLSEIRTTTSPTASRCCRASARRTRRSRGPTSTWSSTTRTSAGRPR